MLEAAAFAIKSRVHGEIPAAAIVLAPTAAQREPVYFQEFCRRALGARGPRRIIVVEAIPRNRAGKALRREIAAAFA